MGQDTEAAATKNNLKPPLKNNKVLNSFLKNSKIDLYESSFSKVIEDGQI
jgi:hypothetical protein